MRPATALAGVCLTTALALSLLHARADQQPAAAGQQQTTTTKPITPADTLAWKSVQGGTLSPDGLWFGYRIAAAEGNSGEFILRQTKSGEEKRFAGGRGGATFSDDSKWITFTAGPGGGGGRRGGGGGGKRGGGKADAAVSPQARLTLMELATGKQETFDGMRRVVFSPDGSGWLALQRQPAAGAAAGAAADTGGRRGGRGQAAAPADTGTAERANGSDLILHELATGQEFSIGNVSEFAFDKKGQYLAMVIDAAGQAGNGIQLRHLASSTQTTLDAGKATYRGLTWTENGEALSVLKGTDDPAFETKRYSLMGFANVTAKPVIKIVYDPQSDPAFPQTMTISPNRVPSWTDSHDAFVFGIHELKKRPTTPATPNRGRAGGAMDDDGEDFADQPPRQPQPRGRGPAEQPPAQRQGGAATAEKPDLVIWHWQDPRLQSVQQVQEAQDRNFNFVCMYRVQDNKFLRLADDTVRNVTIAPKQRYAIGINSQPYELSGTLDGRRYQDVYVIDLKTGQRKEAFMKHRNLGGGGFSPSPTGTHVLYYNDGQFYSYDLATGQSVGLTSAAATRFINDDDDHNVPNPPTQVVGWTKDGQSVLISDGWDVWQFPVQGGSAKNLTVDGKRDSIRYRPRINVDPQERGIDLSKPQYFTIYGEWTKKNGVAVLEGSGCRKVLWDDAGFGGVTKAKNADVFVYTRETNREAPEYYLADGSLANGKKITDIGATHAEFAWSSGAKLIEYKGTEGKRLQGALYLPANYEPGKRYPTIVYIYEKLSQSMNRYVAPRATGFNKSFYLSNGYAVLEPDITYKLNDPGRSAVWCVLPALEAAIATGVVDRDHVGLHGHSWGGYQTSFLITQTDVFKCALAGAPVTNIISMYNSIYWNTGTANHALYESSQVRFTGPPWELMEDYVRNSPITFAKNIKTPLLILHNDRDGAVDFNQGIEYYNTLRRLGKPVVMLEYLGENHSVARPVNARDYAVRMHEYFDHHLMGKPAPDWWANGVPRLKMDEHLDKSRSGGGGQ